MSFGGTRSSSINVLCECLSPCGVRPAAIGLQHASARATAPRPRTGIPGVPTIGTGRAGCGALAGYQPDTAGVKSHVPNPPRRQCGASSPCELFLMYPRSKIAASTLARVRAATVSGRLSTADTVPVETPAPGNQANQEPLWRVLTLDLRAWLHQVRIAADGLTVVVKAETSMR